MTRPHVDHERGAERIRALASPLRLRLVELLLAEGPLTVSELTGQVTVGQPTVSHHLRALIDAEWLKRTIRGRNVIYEVTDADTLARVLALATSRP